MQIQMSILETPPPAGAAPVWATLDEQQRAAVVTALARLIAKWNDGDDAANGEEQHDE